MQSDWLRGVQYWPYLYSVFNICTLFLVNNNKKNQLRFPYQKIRNVFIKNKLLLQINS